MKVWLTDIRTTLDLRRSGVGVPLTMLLPGWTFRVKYATSDLTLKYILRPITRVLDFTFRVLAHYTAEAFLYRHLCQDACWRVRLSNRISNLIWRVDSVHTWAVLLGRVDHNCWEDATERTGWWDFSVDCAGHRCGHCDACTTPICH